MKYTNIMLSTAVVAFLATGCVKPTQDTQQVTYGGSQDGVSYNTSSTDYSTTATDYSGYSTDTATETSTGVYTPATVDTTEVTTSGVNYPTTEQTTYVDNSTYTQSGATYPTTQPTYSDNTSYTQSGTSYSTTAGQTTTGTYPQSGTTYANNTTAQSTYTQSTSTYTNPYEQSSGGSTSYPDPYLNGSSSTTSSSYSSSSSYSTPSSSSASSASGIQLQVAAFKDYYAAQEFKNRLSLAPGQSAYIKRGAMNKVIVTGISSIAEANRLKNTRFPGAFIVKGGSLSGYSSSSYTSSPSYSSGITTTYTVDNPYGTTTGGSSYGSSSYATHGKFGVQIGAFSTRSKAQNVANSQSGSHPAIVKKVGRLYKVILTGFSTRSSAKSYANRVDGFVVSNY